MAIPQIETSLVALSHPSKREINMNPAGSNPMMFNNLLLLFVLVVALAWYLEWWKGKHK